MRRWVWGLALAMVLSVNGALHTPVYADEKTALNGTLTTTIEFEKGSVDQAKHWIDSTVELAKEDMENAMKDASKEEKKQLKKALKELKKTNSNTLLTKRPDGSAEMKNILPGVEIRVGGKKATTRHNGKFTIPQVPLGKHVMRITKEGKLIRELDVVVKRGQPRMDIDLQIYEKQFQENVNRMHQAMGHHHPDSATVQGTATYPELKEGQLVGKGEGRMGIISDPTKGEPKNIVSCNKADGYESPVGKRPFDPAGTEEWESDTWRFPANLSDCSRSIMLGFLYNQSSLIFGRYHMSEYCVIESINAVMGEEPKDKDQYAAYCNWKQKGDGHWNCSWFNGIKHTEELHTH
ncbi:hypothetical protein [Kroppenstedtia eburnea]|uniref:Carboxypeptidase regulatory-like domain-containing protein n=2 Tax=Kroppenstedtia eburnea TaxID=714067 RepID=A0A1N7IY04_9BACL|nr:hypothetical protein [Kroppenstedtia eburnea]QKI82316.1 carboxypeptidase-like regulatory domain-containing protein [Kroppenstedtia eburnea]SIS41988.1 hypothetical protein SAMN05421790_101493 [Kroppenstedtia eburnea]